uniref:Uncharacterized protein n=1 Tax=Vibrio phage P018-4 TaxID=3229728 RepID=A0AB39AJD8_9CAUD
MKSFTVSGENTYVTHDVVLMTSLIEHCFKGELAPTYMKDSPFYQSGYIPCKCCHDKTKDMTDEEAFKWLGRNPFDVFTKREEWLLDTLDKVNTERFQFISCKYDFDVVEYGLWLEKQLEQLEGL